MQYRAVKLAVGKCEKKTEMEAAVNRLPRPSSRTPNAIAALKNKSKGKSTKKQFRIIPWEEVKDNPPPQLNISLVEAIPHKSL